MHEIRLATDFINCLSPEGKRWLARAVVNMINIDGKLDPNEMPYLQDAVILIDESERADLLDHAQKREYMELPNLTTDRQYAGEILYYFAFIIAADNKINVNEAEFFKAIGAKLGFPDEMTKETLRWTEEQIKLQKERREMEIRLGKLNPIFKTVEAKIHEMDANQHNG